MYMEDRILVVIPYYSGGAQGREIEYCIAGWRRHFKEKFVIVVVGDYHPIVDTGDDIVYIHCSRVPDIPGEYRCHLDWANKFHTVYLHYLNTKGFVKSADDVYAVNDFDMSDIMFLKQRDNYMGGNPFSKNGWQRNKAKTRERLAADGYPTRNFTTHLPQYYEWDKWKELFDRYKMDKNSYILEDLYYNIYYPDRIPFQICESDNLKCGLYEHTFPAERVKNAFKTKIWIQNSTAGWSKELDAVLRDYYGI